MAQTKVNVPVVFAVIWFEIGWERFLFLSPTVELNTPGKQCILINSVGVVGMELSLLQVKRHVEEIFDRGAAWRSTPKRNERAH